YHIGFRQQVLSWPTNPVTHYISLIQSSFPPKSVIADLGCGDAALAKALIHKGYNVLSFDLVSNDDYVVAADICEKVPLPGGDEGGKIVDLVLCSLSLMSTNWLGCIKEAKRILTDRYVQLVI
ncbi:25S rRNA (adenine645-N1)-methyltransferase, partial [Tulasnella sp. 419]